MASKTLGEMSTLITKGATPTTYGHKWQAFGVPFLRSECVSSRGLDMRQSMFISEGADQSLRRSRVKEGDILMTITGNVGRVVRLAGIGSANINQHIARVRIKDRNFDPGYVYHFLSQGTMREYYESIVTGQAFPQISLAQVRSTPIPEIGIEEQRTIARALDDAASLIGTLELLIAKKQAIKQGMMQDLLTGRTRLPGFADPWHTGPLKQYLPLQRGFDLPTTKVEAGPFPVVYSNGVARHHSKWMVRGPGVVTGRSGTIGAVHFIENDYWPHNTSLWVTSFARVEARFAYYFLTHLGLERFASGSGVPTFNRNDAHSFVVTLPSDHAEQSAIAEVLRDTDAEVAALVHRLEKARSIKNGMMQQLLTGRVRLPVEDAA
jgi:type I restriction enzyme S subunit